MSHNIPVSPLSEDLFPELRDILHDWGDRFCLTQGIDEDGWYLTITDRPAVPNGRMAVARSIGEARAWLEKLSSGSP